MRRMKQMVMSVHSLCPPRLTAWQARDKQALLESACRSYSVRRAVVLCGALVSAFASDLPAQESRRAVDPPSVRSFPASPRTIQRWIDTLDTTRIREHGWDVLESISRPSGAAGKPVWETWYSGHEVFDLGAERTASGRATFHDFGRPSQFHHQALGLGEASRHIPFEGPEQVLAFNRYSPSLARTIWLKGYHKASTLNDINVKFDQEATPVAERAISASIGPVDARSVCLKPVFQFIDGGSPTVVPYWAGISPLASTNLANPEPHTWRQAVLVDPTARLKPGSRRKVSFNGERHYDALVVPLSQFYHIRVTTRNEPERAGGHAHRVEGAVDRGGQQLHDLPPDGRVEAELRRLSPSHATLCA